MGVTEYYDLFSIKAKDDLYVIGSDVFGSMGKEFTPLLQKSEGFTQSATARVQLWG